MTAATRIFTAATDRGEVLIYVFPDHADIAFREGDRWGVPTKLAEVSVEATA